MVLVVISPWFWPFLPGKPGQGPAARHPSPVPGPRSSRQQALIVTASWAKWWYKTKVTVVSNTNNPFSSFCMWKDFPDWCSKNRNADLLSKSGENDTLKPFGSSGVPQGRLGTGVACPSPTGVFISRPSRCGHSASLSCESPAHSHAFPAPRVQYHLLKFSESVH